MRQKLNLNPEPKEILWGYYWFVLGDIITCPKGALILRIWKCSSPANNEMLTTQCHLKLEVFIAIHSWLILLHFSCPLDSPKYFPSALFWSAVTNVVLTFMVPMSEGLTIDINLKFYRRIRNKKKQINLSKWSKFVIIAVVIERFVSFWQNILPSKYTLGVGGRACNSKFTKSYKMITHNEGWCFMAGVNQCWGTVLPPTVTKQECEEAEMI